MKHILGRKGRFGPLDVVDIALENRHHAPYLMEQLWGYFSPRTVPPRLLRTRSISQSAAFSSSSASMTTEKP